MINQNQYGRIKFFTAVILFMIAFQAYAQENPFMQMAGKKYAEYEREYNNAYEKFRQLTDTVEARAVIRQIEEVYEKTGDILWKMKAAFFETVLDNRKRELYGEEMFSSEEITKRRENLLKEMEKEDVKYLELELRQNLIDWYWKIKEYELAFELCAVQAKQLDKITAKDIPEKIVFLRLIGDFHYYFKDYPQAIYFFSKVLEDNTDDTPYPNSKQHARNGLGLSYRQGYNDLDRSDSCFLLIIQPETLNSITDEPFLNIWIGIAEGNLGRNRSLRREYDQAIPLLQSSLERMVKADDYGFAVEIAADLAKIYIEKGDVEHAKYYVSWATEHYTDWRYGVSSRIYETWSKYYALIGNGKLSMAYMDSLLIENNNAAQQFSAIQMLRAEQKQNIAEHKLKEEQLNAEKIKKERYKRSLIISVLAVLVFGGGLVRYYVMFRKKRAAYHELVLKSQAWAQVAIHTGHEEAIAGQEDAVEPTGQEKQNDTPDETDLLIMKEIEKAMQDDKRYIDSELSIDSLAHILGAKKHYIPRAINRCTNKNFNTFVNEYRIKEAIRILSDNDAHTLTLDSVAFDVGFTDRWNFYRVFKKMTGLSPTEFRKNMNN
jgi:YesN/AraC family two-component response regulator